MTDSQEQDNLYTIAEWNLPKVYKKLAAMNKRAVKLDCPLIVLTEVAERYVTDPDKKRVGMTPAQIAELPKIRVVDITIEGEGPKLAGWKFIGTLDHATLPGKVIVNTVPGENIPPLYYHNEAVCDHCGKIRRRKETFVVEHEEGDMKQVGRQCIKDFMGHDPAAIARYLQSIYRMMEELEDDDYAFGGGGGGGSYEVYYDKNQVLQVAAAIIDKFGWVAKSAVSQYDDDAPTPTSFRVAYWFNRPCRPTNQELAEWKAFRAKVNAEDPRWEKEAVEAREWLKTQPTNNEYLHNLHNINEVGEDEAKANGTEARFPAKLLGYWASLVSAYQRAQERLKYKEIERKKKVNEHVGNVKDRIDLVVEIKRKTVRDGQWGTVTIVNMLDEGGHTITWFANTEVTMHKGDKYRIKATIKKHDEYNDWKQTIVTRVKVLEELTEDE